MLRTGMSDEKGYGGSFSIVPNDRTREICQETVC